MKRKKRIETVNVLLPEALLLTSLLNLAENQQYSDRGVRLLSLRKIEESSDYYLGAILTTKQEGIPPKHNPESGAYSEIQLNQEEGEGLGYSNVFIYHKANNILMYEFNKNGCYLSGFGRFLEILFNSQHDSAVGIEFTPVLKREAYNRIQNMQVYKSLSVKIKMPERIRTEFLDENDSISAAISDGVRLGSDTIELKFELKGRPIDGMPRNIVKNLYDRARSIFDRHDHETMEKIVIDGYYHDPDSDTTKRASVDIIFDRYIKYIEIEEPSVLSNPQTNLKSQALKALYLDIRDDFSIF